jgi:hypothetical protein
VRGSHLPASEIHTQARVNHAPACGDRKGTLIVSLGSWIAGGAGGGVRCMVGRYFDPSAREAIETGPSLQEIALLASTKSPKVDANSISVDFLTLKSLTLIVRL